MPNQHVVPHQGRWAVKAEGATRPTEVFRTQKEAIDHAKTIARNQEVEVKIHGRNGRIRKSISYGPDPFPPRG